MTAGSASLSRARQAPASATGTRRLRQQRSTSLPPVLADGVNLFAERLELIVAPRFLLEQRRHRLARRALEEHAHQIADGFLLRRRARRHRRVDVADAFG